MSTVPGVAILLTVLAMNLVGEGLNDALNPRLQAALRPARVLELSQVILGVRDLDAATHRMEALGLTVLDGGVHPGVGTANRIVPLGRQYLELLGVVDEALARAGGYGRALLAAIADGDRLVRWSLRTDRIEEVAARLGLSRGGAPADAPRWRPAHVEGRRDRAGGRARLAALLHAVGRPRAVSRAFSRSGTPAAPLVSPGSRWPPRSRTGSRAGRKGPTSRWS